MPDMTIRPSGKIYSYETGKSLLDILLEKGIFVDNPCNGKGICGKCRVKILSGILPPVHATQRELLRQEELDKGIRLACLVVPQEDLEIGLPPREREHGILATGYMPDLTLDCDIIKEVIKIERPGPKEQTSFEDRVREQAHVGGLDLDLLAGVDPIPGTMTVVSHGGQAIQLEQGDTADVLYGAAIDIGTTTVVCALIDMHTGAELAHASMINAQKRYGLDVLTRITYASEHPETGTADLQRAIVGSINHMIQEICRQAGIQREDIYEIAVGANCTMMHMLLGVDAGSIGKAPYAPVFVKAKDIPASQIGLKAAAGARLYCLPSVSAYIGADIVAGTYVCGLREKDENILFIDIGTNGEIVLSHHGKLLCCSCAAGPALEGMGIRCGMRAAQGAIEDVRITEEGVKVTVIGDVPPVGICGSGILAAVKELLRVGLIRPNGTFIKKEHLDPADYRFPMLQLDGKKRVFILTESPERLLITQQDVRQVQLAKGAILSGSAALLNKAGIAMEDLDKVMVAGQFGAHLPADSLTGTGILPAETGDKIRYVGNASKTGAHMALLSAQAKRAMERLADHMDYMELGTTKGYERLFSECLLFPSAGRDMPG